MVSDADTTYVDDEDHEEGSAYPTDIPDSAGTDLHTSVFIANRTCNTTVTGSFRIRYSRIWHDPAIFPVIGPSVLRAANQNACVMTQ